MAEKSKKAASHSTIRLLNGPNLNLLGTREQEIYGRESLADIEHKSAKHASALGHKLEASQSNAEGELVELIQNCRGTASGLIINPAAYTHTSIAIRDALSCLDIPVVEVHLSNIHKREEFRRHSYASEVAHGVICGFGSHSYILAIDALHQLIK